MTACSQVLESPELLTMILEYLIDGSQRPDPALVAATRVNHTWFEIATDLLWGFYDSTKTAIGDWITAPGVLWSGEQAIYDDRLATASKSVEALIGVKRSRRQKYADKIRVLTFGSHPDWETHTLFVGLQFSRLRVFAVSGHRIFSISQYIQPSLEVLSVSFCGRPCSDAFLDSVAASCSHLTAVSFEFVTTPVSPTKLIDFLSKIAGSLQSLELRFKKGCSVQLISEDLIALLSRSKMLRRLHISDDFKSPLLPEEIQPLRYFDYKPFPNLVDLSIQLSSERFSFITDLTSDVEMFELGVTRMKAPCFHHIAAMSGIRELTIGVKTDKPIAADQFLALGSLRRLQKMCIDITKPNGEERLVVLSEDEFARFSSGLTQLTHLELSFELKGISSHRLSWCLSRNCPMLKYLKLAMFYNVQSLARYDPSLFPVLEYLSVEGLYSLQQVREFLPFKIAQILDNHAPNLRDIAVAESGRSWEVVDAWRERYGPLEL